MAWFAAYCYPGYAEQWLQKDHWVLGSLGHSNLQFICTSRLTRVVGEYPDEWASRRLFGLLLCFFFPFPFSVFHFPLSPFPFLFCWRKATYHNDLTAPTNFLLVLNWLAESTRGRLMLIKGRKGSDQTNNYHGTSLASWIGRVPWFWRGGGNSLALYGLVLFLSFFLSWANRSLTACWRQQARLFLERERQIKSVKNIEQGWGNLGHAVLAVPFVHSKRQVAFGMAVIEAPVMSRVGWLDLIR